VNRVRVLYVEDDPINALVMQKLLEADFLVLVAENGDRAVSILETENFDLFLLDINLGNDSFDGIQLLKIIKSEERFKNKKVIAVTSYGMQEDKERFLREGFDYHIAKPLIKENILNLIYSVIRK
jgi:CheY-like chemotaxis protein